MALVDDDDLRRLEIVGSGERAPAAERDAHDLEVVGRHGVERHLDVLLLGGHLTPVDA